MRARRREKVYYTAYYVGGLRDKVGPTSCAWCNSALDVGALAVYDDHVGKPTCSLECCNRLREPGRGQ